MSARQIGITLGAFVGMVLSVLAPASTASATDIKGAAPAAATVADPILAYGARIAGDDARTRVVIELDRAPSVAVHYLADPPRVVVDLPATAFGFPAKDLDARGLFTAIRYGTMDKDSARIVLTAAKPAKLVMARVQQNESGKGYRLVLDAEMVPPEQYADLVRKQTWSDEDIAADVGPVVPVENVKPSDFLIAVDAGHGGIDAGAMASDGSTPEKQITLAFAKALAEKLNAQPGIKAFLTRDSDAYLSLSQRVTIARQNHAALFISLHADTLKQKDIRGSTVYTISDRASDRLAADVADRENSSDKLAGTETRTTPPVVADILMDLTRRETQAFSVSLAQDVLNSFNGQIAMINNPHRYAGFQVLTAPDVPSILVELGFLSNKEDEKLLLDDAWRAKLVDRLAEAVRQYRAETVANGG